MSLRNEQYEALLRTRELLQDLSTSENYPKTRKEMRERVRRCVKHYPPLTEEGEPMFSKN